MSPTITDFDPGTGPIFFESLDCGGTEPFVTKCRGLPKGVHTCTHSDDVGVRCPGKQL